jgi:glycolate oxidase iron-sulfur subunit
VAEPRAILAAAGYTVVETDPVALCCGAAGMYTIHKPEASARLGAQKADQVRRTGLSKVASANPGCEMQLRSHLEPHHDIRHPIEWYLDALTSDSRD